MAVVERAAYEDFIIGLDRDFALPPLERPDAARTRLRQALTRADFYVQCAERALLHGASPQLVTDPLGRYVLKLFCWPPGFGNEPHRHGSWTVAGVLSGSLLVSRSAVSAADCLASAPLPARVGDVGMLVPPQFHCLRNDGPEAAVTLHLFSLDPAQIAPDREDGADDAPHFDDEDVLSIARMAVQRGHVDAVDCVEAGFAVVGPAAQLELVKLMLTLSPERAVNLGRTLSSLVGGEDGRRLLQLIERLETGRGALAMAP